MSRDLVTIKGGKDGFRLLVDSSASMEEIEAEIKKKLDANPGFFPEGTKFELEVADLDRSVKKGIGQILSQHGLGVELSARKEAPAKPKEQPQPVSQAAIQHDGNVEAQEMTVVDHTIRGGEEVTSQGSVLIMGNVNPGAQIIAGGSIDIRGTCRGMVHAGAWGDTSAVVIADRLMPTQIRIANMIARSPDIMEKNNFAERASIKDGQIIIEPIER
ncbi:Septum site-determining protein MinC [Anaerovibrio sp. JC8]|uniref:septum site-determining protein MinC n=1 Tax=Anaerovibrio sp. JC8 TaxID=1240085 RepID=UPI000A0B60B2|nr:septum site-determining protein MinC [Anaerovibrio sp. JC8]ORU01252.1 Septum site-determining protein MinC [Anaerovibrio sp. JC8]